MGKHPETGGGLAAGAFEFVVKNGVFKAGKIERGCVAHQADPDVVGEAVAEEAFGESGGAHEEIAGDGQAKLDADQGPEVVRNAGFCRCGDDHTVHDEFGYPKHPQWHQSPYEAAGEGRNGQEGAGLPDHPEKRGQVAECVETVAPRDRRFCLWDVRIQKRF